MEEPTNERKQEVEPVPQHEHHAPDFPLPPRAIAGLAIAPGGLIAVLIAYGVIVLADKIIQIFSPDGLYELAAKYCHYYWFPVELAEGDHLAIEVDGNEQPTGEIEIFVTPQAPNGVLPGPTKKFYGNGHVDAYGPGYVTIHLNTDRPDAQIKVSLHKKQS